MGKVIEVNGLAYGYSEKLVFENISFSVDKGDFLGLIGPNGSGKSTIIKLLLGSIRPLRGEIKILGERIDRFRKWEKIGYVAQKATAFNSSFPATVEEVVAANLFPKIGIFKRVTALHKEQVYDALKMVDMHKYSKRLIGNLSGGQQQRVFIARVLVNQPEIMFLDEPTVGVDAKSEEAVYCLLARLNKDLNITVVIITHDISAVTVHANKLACLDNKELVMVNPADRSFSDVIANSYGYGVNIFTHKHNCKIHTGRDAG